MLEPVIGDYAGSAKHFGMQLVRASKRPSQLHLALGICNGQV